MIMNEDQKNIEKCLSEQVGTEIVNAATGDKFDALVTEAWTGERPAHPYTSWIVEFKSILILFLRKLYYTPLSLFSNTSIKDFIAGLQATIVTLQAAIASMLGDIATSYQKVSEKGGTIPQEQTSANLPAAIESIPSGGDAYGIFFPCWHNPLKVLKNNLSEEYPCGVCYLFMESQLSVTAPTCDRIVFADGTYIDNPSGIIELKFDTLQEKSTTYIICLYTTPNASVTAAFNDSTLYGIAAYGISLSLGTSSASYLTVAQFENCIIDITARKPINGSSRKYYYDSNCTFTYIQYFDLFIGNYCYLYSDYEWPNSQYIASLCEPTLQVDNIQLPNVIGNHFANQADAAPMRGAIGLLYAPKLNTYPSIRRGICYSMKLGKITFVDTWTMNTIQKLAYVEIGEDTDIDMDLRYSRIYLDYISTPGGIDMINANLVRGIGNKVKDNSGTGVTRVITLPASVFAILASDTKAVFTNKGWTIAGA